MPIMNGLQPMHLLLVLAIIVIVFGPSKLPELGASLGKGIREFKRGTDEINEVKESVTSAVSLEPAKKPVAAATPLPSQPEPRHEAVVLSRQEID
jgi:TatA/E family protein of Tat protein translocase